MADNVKVVCRDIPDTECATYGNSSNVCSGCPAIGSPGKRG